MHNNKVFKLLLDLGLTEYETKALTTLFKYIEADAPQISRYGEIPKTRVYDVLEKLKLQGLILEIYGRPKRYKVINPQEVFNFLMNKKKKEIEILNKDVEEVLYRETWANNIQGVKEKILQVKTVGDYNKILSQEFEHAKNEIQGFTDLNIRSSAFQSLLNKPELSVKLITNPVSKVSLPEHIEYKEREHSMDAYIIDKNKVIMSLNDIKSDNAVYNLTIFQNNPSLTKAIKSHFDETWK